MSTAYEYRVRRCAGNTGFEIRKAVEMPGEWYYERTSPLVWRGPLQKPAMVFYLHVGFAEED